MRLFDVILERWPSRIEQIYLWLPFNRETGYSSEVRAAGDAAIVTRWAGHSVAVMLRVYAKVVDGTEQELLDRIWNTARRPAKEARPRAAIGTEQPYSPGYGQRQPDSGPITKWANALVKGRSPWCGRCWVRTNVG